MQAVNTPTLETERLILRRFTADDAHAVFAIFRDAEANTFLPRFPLRSLEEARAYLDGFLAEYEKPAGTNYAICLKSDNIPIGYIGIGADAAHDLGYGLRKEHWRQGIVTEAGTAVIAQARYDGVPYVTATHDVRNRRSGAVMQRLGMRYRYTYEEQWQPKDILVTFRMYQRNLDGQEDRVYREYWDRYPVHYVETRVDT